eukprot:378579-Rhodomonas_salina.1
MFVINTLSFFLFLICGITIKQYKWSSRSQPPVTPSAAATSQRGLMSAPSGPDSRYHYIQESIDAKTSPIIHGSYEIKGGHKAMRGGRFVVLPREYHRGPNTAPKPPEVKTRDGEVYSTSDPGFQPRGGEPNPFVGNLPTRDPNHTEPAGAMPDTSACASVRVKLCKRCHSECP